MTLPAYSEIAAYRSPILVYDGSCGFCSRSVQFMLRHERRHDLLFVTRDSELGSDCVAHRDWNRFSRWTVAVLLQFQAVEIILDQWRLELTTKVISTCPAHPFTRSGTG
ncbi:MAG: DUF393 domain-containing protein [Acidobacteriaceae bacterium]|nr:DUF393 domain-containing protein [Acidobacteriaceae bacterium]